MPVRPKARAGMTLVAMAAVAGVAIMAGAAATPSLHAQTLLHAQNADPGAGPGPNPAEPMQAPPGVQPGQSLDASGGMFSTEERDQVRAAVREDTTLVKEAVEGVAPSANQGAGDPPVIVGRPLPPTLPARRAPDSLIAKLPSRPNHEVWIFGNNLALIDRDTREVTDIVQDIF